MHAYSRLIVRSCATIFILVVTGSMAEAKECPPKDTYVCTIQEGADKGKEVIVMQRPQKFVIKNGALFGSVLKKDAATAIDQQPLDGSGHIYEMSLTPGEKTYRFAKIDQFDDKADMNSILQTAKRGTATVLPLSGQGTYTYDGSPKRLMLCQEKYFQQLNTHTKDADLNDADICKMMNGEDPKSGAAGASGAAPAKPAPKVKR